jgi:hypothetical protein
MKKYLKDWIPARVVIGVVVVLYEIGSALQEDWGSAIVAMLFALFLTVPPDAIKDKLKVRYGLALIVALVLFILGTHTTMTSFAQDTQVTGS